MFYKLVRFVRFPCGKIVISNIDFEIVSFDITTRTQRTCLVCRQVGFFVLPESGGELWLKRLQRRSTDRQSGSGAEKHTYQLAD